MTNIQDKVDITKAIKSFTLSNFRSWESDNSFEIKNLNLLFGKNSSGKSSVIDALSLLSQSSYLKYHGNYDIKTNLSLGDLVINGHLAELGDIEDLIFKKRSDPKEERWQLKNFHDSSISYYKDLFFEFKLDPKIIFNQFENDPLLTFVRHVYIKYSFSDITGHLVRRSFYIEDYNKKRILLLDLWKPKNTQAWAFKVTNDRSLWSKIWNIESSENGQDYVLYSNKVGDAYGTIEMDRFEEDPEEQIMFRERNKEVQNEITQLIVDKDDLNLELKKVRASIREDNLKFKEAEFLLNELRLTTENAKDDIQLSREMQNLEEEINRLKYEEDQILPQIDSINNEIKNRQRILEYTETGSKIEIEKVLLTNQIDKLVSLNSNHTKNKNLLRANIESFGEILVQKPANVLRRFIRNNYNHSGEEYKTKLDPFDMAAECEETLLHFLLSIVRIGPHRKRPQRTMTASSRQNDDKFNIGVDASDLYPLLSDKKILSELNLSLEKVEIPYTISTRKSRGGRWSLILKNKTGVRVDINDVGYGISQVLPLILQSFQKNKVILIEQPELHLHPKLQANLADIFINSSQDNGNTFMIETHSEHLVLRLQRRCREHSKSENIDSKNNLAEMININVITQDNLRLNSKNKKMEISKKGEFMNVWPDGFFEERFVELGILDEED